MAHQRILPASLMAILLLLGGASNRLAYAEQSVQEQSNELLSQLLGYLAEKGVGSNAESLVEDMRRQAETGDPRAYFYLGKLYHSGPTFSDEVAISKDPASAVNAYAQVISAAARRHGYDQLIGYANYTLSG